MLQKLVLVGAITVGFFAVAQVPSFAQTAPQMPAANSNLEQRIQQRKRERTIQVDERDQTRFSRRCTNAQSRIRSLQQQASSRITQRTSAYQKIDGTLWVTIGRLKLAQISTDTLEQQRTTLTQKSSQFRQTGDVYLQTLDDISAIDCQNDIIGFLALLETARLYQTSLRTQANDMRSFVTNDISSTLSGYADSLRDGTASQSQEGGE